MTHRTKVGLLGVLLLAAPAWALKIGDPAPELNFSDWVKGEEISLGEATEGKIVVLEWWATWCGPCQVTIPHLTELQHKYGDKVIIIGATAKDPNNSKQDVKKFVKEWDDRMKYTVAFDASGKVDQAYMRAFGANSIPKAFVIDQAGKLAWVGHPSVDMDSVIDQMLAGEFDPEKYAKADELVGKLEAAIRKGQSKRIKELVPEAMEIVGSADDLGRLAYYMLHDKKLKRDVAEEALEMAERANMLSDGESWRVLDAYALALFENEQVGKAVRTQKKAIMNCDDAQATAMLEKNLETYEKEREKLASR